MLEIDTSKIFEEVMNGNEVNSDLQTSNNENFYYDEEDLLKNHEKDFTYQVKQRGLDYYNSNNVINVFKDKNKYIAKVMGSDSDIYNVVIEVTKDGINYDCTCPCTFPCKHEYAVLNAIDNKEYLEVELKETVKEQDKDIKSIIEKIPAEEIKTYLLSEIGMNKVVFETEAFSNYFRKYYPLQKYEYYYNNLYNALVTKDEYIDLTQSYLNRVKQYISSNYFNEVLNIIKALINAYNDTNNLKNDDYFTDMLPNIGMFLRVIYRKSDEQLKEKINEWIAELEAQNFYNNYYLEDIMLSIKSI